VTISTAQTIKNNFRILRIAARLIVITWEIVRDALVHFMHQDREPC
jgi:hypothetical protein